MIGQVLNGTYRLTDLLGSGGYADVYLARDLRSNTVVAVKLLHPHVAKDPNVAARFEREAALARRLQTPYVARVLDAGQDPASTPFLVMELVQGLTVHELIRRRGPFPIAEVADILDQLLSALGAAHALGIVHRDVKPQNLMLDAEHRLKVLDFGIARVAGTVTASGHMLGTPEYMAAEQISGAPIDHRTDLYAAGAVMYQLLSGRAPFLRYSGSDLWDLIRRVERDRPPPIRQLRPEVSPELGAVVERAMAKDPAQRFQSAYEMRLALAAATGGDPPTPLPSPLTIQRPDETQVMPTPVFLPPDPGGSAGGPAGSGGPGWDPSVPRPPNQSPRGSVPSWAPRPPPGRPQAMPIAAQAGPDRSRMPTWQRVGLGLGALVLVIVGLAVVRTMLAPGDAPLPAPTASRSLAAATSSPRAGASPASFAQPGAAGPGSSPGASPGAGVGALPIGPGPSPASGAATAISAPAVNPSPPSAPSAPPPKPTNQPGVLLSDTFENAEIGQLPRVSPRPNDYTFAYDGGEYVIQKINEKLPAAPIVFLPGSYDNSVIAVDIRIVGDVASRYAFVVCRDQSSGGQARQYRASIVPEGRRLIVSRWDDGNQRVLAESRDDPAINPGNGTNRLELRCANARISAAVNGKMLVSADDMTLSRGDQGIGAGTFAGVDGTLEARYDNLQIRQP